MLAYDLVGLGNGGQGDVVKYVQEQGHTGGDRLPFGVAIIQARDGLLCFGQGATDDKLNDGQKP